MPRLIAKLHYCEVYEHKGTLWIKRGNKTVIKIDEVSDKDCSHLFLSLGEKAEYVPNEHGNCDYEILQAGFSVFWKQKGTLRVLEGEI